MQLDILTPDRKVFSGEVEAVQMPGSMGSFQVLKNHAPIISTLMAGRITVRTKDNTEIFNIKGGVVEVLNNTITILSEGASDND